MATLEVASTLVSRSGASCNPLPADTFTNRGKNKTVDGRNPYEEEMADAMLLT